MSKKRPRKTSASKSSTSSSASKLTTNHEMIKNWVEERGGKPATVKNTSNGDVGILRIDFPGYSGEGSLDQISWDEFFEKFDNSKLAFLYQEETTDGQQSRFNKFVSEDKEASTGEPGKSEMD